MSHVDVFRVSSASDIRHEWWCKAARAGALRGPCSCWVENPSSSGVSDSPPANVNEGERWSDDELERYASAAFEWDRRNGHHEGTWSWHMIPEVGRQNYREMVRAVFSEAEFVPAKALREAEGALRRIFDYAYGASGVTGDDAGHLTHVGMMAKDALAGIGPSPKAPAESSVSEPEAGLDGSER